MALMARKHSIKRTNHAKAMELFHKLQKEGLGDEQFRGMTEEQIIQALKKTREEIWKEKLAARP